MIDTATTNLRAQHHPGCFVCGPLGTHGLQQSFVLTKDGVATGEFACESRYEGYVGLLHGGIISALLDGAMTNCLFLHGQVAVTAELVVRFRHPVVLERPAQVRAWITVADPPVFRLKAQIEQDGIIKAEARAAFMLPKPHSLPSAEGQP